MPGAWGNFGSRFFFFKFESYTFFASVLQMNWCWYVLPERPSDHFSDSTIRGLIRLGKKIYGSRSGVLQHGHFGIEGVLLFLGKKCLIFTPFYRKFYSILGLGKKKFGKHFKYSFVQWSSQPGACLHGMDYIELSHLIWNWI